MSSRKIFYVIFFFLGFPAYAQQVLILDSCQLWAKDNYPVIKQMNLIEQSKEYSISNANAFYFPQVVFTGKATLQNEVPSINSSILPFPVDFSYSVRKDQYQIALTVEQLLFQGIQPLKNQKNIAIANAQIQNEQVTTTLYAIRQQINQIYLGVLLIDKQLEQLEITKNTLLASVEKLQSMYKNEMASMTDLDLLQAEIIQLDQQGIQMKSMKINYLHALSTFIQKPLREETILEVPTVEMPAENTENQRPELALYEAQSRIFDFHKKNINIANSPRLSLYLQGGFGAPGFNYFSNDFMPMGVVGLKLQWNISGFFTAKNDKRLLDIQKETVAIQKATFLLNNDLEKQKYQDEITKIQQLIESDTKMIDLRRNVRQSAETKLQQGMLSTIDYIKFTNDERLAFQNKILHEMQLLIAIYNLKHIQNN